VVGECRGSAALSDTANVVYAGASAAQRENVVGAAALSGTATAEGSGRHKSHRLIHRRHRISAVKARGWGLSDSNNVGAAVLSGTATAEAAVATRVVA